MLTAKEKHKRSQQALKDHFNAFTPRRDTIMYSKRGHMWQLKNIDTRAILDYLSHPSGVTEVRGPASAYEIALHAFPNAIVRGMNSVKNSPAEFAAWSIIQRKLEHMEKLGLIMESSSYYWTITPLGHANTNVAFTKQLLEGKANDVQAEGL